MCCCLDSMDASPRRGGGAVSLQAAGLPKAAWAWQQSWILSQVAQTSTALGFRPAPHQGRIHITWLLFVAVSTNTTVLILVQIFGRKKLCSEQHGYACAGRGRDAAGLICVALNNSLFICTTR